MRKELRAERNSRILSRVKLFFYEIKRVVTGKLFPNHGKKRLLKAKTKATIFVWAMLAIPIAWFLLFWVYVNFNSILLAFKNIDYGTGNEYWTLKNFKTIWGYFTLESPAYNLAKFFGNTLKYWSLAVFWGIPHSILLTYLFHKKLRGMKFFRLTLYLPSIICSVAMAGIFESFIAGNGSMGYILSNFFHVARIPGWFQEAEWATKALIFYSWFFGFAGHYVIFSGAIARIPDEVTEAAYLDGITMWKELWYIVIPLMWPTISMTIIIQFAGIFGASGNILLFTPNVMSTYTLGYFIFDQVRQYGSYYIPAALGFGFTVVAFPLCMLVRKVVTGIYADVD